MMNTLVQSMRSARIKKIKLTIIHQNLHPCWPALLACLLYSLSFFAFCLLPLLAARLQMKSTRPSSWQLGDHLIVQQDKTPIAHRKNEQHAKRTSKQNEYFCPHCSQKCNKFSRIWSEIRYNFHFFSCVLRPFLALRLLTFFVYFFASLLV